MPQPGFAGIKPWKFQTYHFHGTEFQITGTPCVHIQPASQLASFSILRVSAVIPNEDEGRREKEKREQAEDGGRGKRAQPTDHFRGTHAPLPQPTPPTIQSRNCISLDYGDIPLPTGKYCPMRLETWTDCPAQQQEIYNSVCNYFQPAEEAQARFSPDRLKRMLDDSAPG